MATGAIISFSDDNKQPNAVVALTNGDLVQLVLSQDGLRITESRGLVLFECKPEVAAQVCTGLVDSTATTTPLEILAGVVAHLRSADEVREAFERATAHLV
jgi:hypothetical protein